LSHQELEESPERSTSGLTSASQIVDTTSVEGIPGVDSTAADEGKMFHLVFPTLPEEPIKLQNPLLDEEFRKLLDEILNEDDELLKRLAG